MINLARVMEVCSKETLLECSDMASLTTTLLGETKNEDEETRYNRHGEKV